MGTLTDHFKSIVAASVVAVGFSLPAAADDAALDALFDDLQVAQGSDADRIGDQIRAEWGKSGSAAIDLLLRRGQEAIDAGDPLAASEHCTAVIDHAPDFAAGYSCRAIAYYLLDLPGPALDDLRQTLALNPRHFDAMRGFAVMLEELERPEEALEVYGRVLDIYPANTLAQEAADRLKLQFEGQAL